MDMMGELGETLLGQMTNPVGTITGAAEWDVWGESKGSIGGLVGFEYGYGKNRGEEDAGRYSTWGQVITKGYF